MAQSVTSISVMNGALRLAPTGRGINFYGWGVGFHLLDGAEAKPAVTALSTAPGRPSFQHAVVASTASGARQAEGRSAHPALIRRYQ